MPPTPRLTPAESARFQAAAAKLDAECFREERLVQGRREIGAGRKAAGIA